MTTCVGYCCNRLIALQVQPPSIRSKLDKARFVFVVLLCHSDDDANSAAKSRPALGNYYAVYQSLQVQLSLAVIIQPIKR